MSRRKQLLWIYLLVLPVFLVMALLLGALLTGSATAHASECQTCHSQVPALSEGKFVCENCDRVSGVHFRGPSFPDHHLIEQLDTEVCFICHWDQYDTFEILASVKSYHQASNMKLMPLEGWSMTGDIPNWNALIDERPLVIGSND